MRLIPRVYLLLHVVWGTPYYYGVQIEGAVGSWK